MQTLKLFLIQMLVFLAIVALIVGTMMIWDANQCQNAGGVWDMNWGSLVSTCRGGV